MKFTNFIAELKSLSNKDIYKRDKIEWWLLKYKEDYQYHYQNKEIRPTMKITYRADTKPHIKKSIDLENTINRFLDTYEVLNKVTDFYRNEVYFKQELELYKSIKADAVGMKYWLAKHNLAESKKYADFVDLFQDNRTLSGYRFDILYPLSLPLKITLDESEFKYTIQFLEILDKANK